MAPEFDEKATFAVSVRPPAEGQAPDGFNEFGVRENTTEDGELESIDVTFDAMKPGVRKNIEVTPEYLKGIAGKYREELPAMLDHSGEQLKQVGKVTDARYSETGESLRLMANIPNTGNSVKADVISDFTHSPPAIDDGSVGFNPQTLEFAESDLDDAAAKFVDGELIEFSFTPFPAGYDEGGLSPVFSEAVDSAVSDFEAEEDAESQLSVANSRLISTN